MAAFCGDRVDCPHIQRVLRIVLVLLPFLLHLTIAIIVATIVAISIITSTTTITITIAVIAGVDGKGQAHHWKNPLCPLRNLCLCLMRPCPLCLRSLCVRPRMLAVGKRRWKWWMVLVRG